MFPDALLPEPSQVKPAVTFQSPSGSTVALNTTDLDHRHPSAGRVEDVLSWVRTKLGGNVWRIEGENPLALQDCFFEALGKYGARVPRIWFETIAPGIFQYRPEAQGVIGVLAVNFITPIQATGGYSAQYMWNANLTGIGVMPQAGPGLIMPSGDLNRFLMMRASFMRVASLKPAWHWDGASRTILISNPSHYNACALLALTKTWSEIDSLDHQMWIRDYTLAKAEYLLATIRSKFDGSITTPGGGSLSLNSDKLMTSAQATIDRLETRLIDFQLRVPITWAD